MLVGCPRVIRGIYGPYLYMRRSVIRTIFGTVGLEGLSAFATFLRAGTTILRFIPEVSCELFFLVRQKVVAMFEDHLHKTKIPTVEKEYRAPIRVIVLVSLSRTINGELPAPF